MRASVQEKFRGLFSNGGEDILGAGFHILSGAGGDLKLLVQQAVTRVVGDAYVSRSEYESLAARLAKLESKTGKTTPPTKKSTAKTRAKVKK